MNRLCRIHYASDKFVSERPFVAEASKVRFGPFASTDTRVVFC